jgi:hypothetical protein
MIFPVQKISLKSKHFALHFFLWLLLFSFPIKDIITGNGNFGVPMVAKMALTFTLFYFNYFVLVPRLLLKKKQALYILVVGAVIVAVSVYLAFYAPPSWHPHMRRFYSQDRLPRYTMGRLRVLPEVFALIMHFSVSSLLRIYAELNDAQKKQAETETEKKTAELNLLKAQLNPHFFFNSLNNIYSLAIKKSEQTPAAILHLSELMRYMLHETNKDVVRLAEELQYIENYIGLQQLRLTENNTVLFEVVGEPKQISLPPLLFISFIENAFKYGVNPSKKSTIAIKFTIGADDIKLFIVNDADMNNDQLSGKAEDKAIENTKKRIALYFPERNILNTYVAENKFIVELTLLFTHA